MRAVIADGDLAGALEHLAEQRREARDIIAAAMRVEQAFAALEVELGVSAPAPEPTLPQISLAPPAGAFRVRVTGPKSGRRRLGRHFGEEAVYFDATAEEVAQLRADASLMVVTA